MRAGAGTPYLDGLIRDGVVFLNAISQATWTKPSIASLMTGLYPSQHRLVEGLTRARKGVVAALDPGLPTLAELLTAHQHATAAFVAGNAHLKPQFGLLRGFVDVFWRPTTDGAAIAADFERWLVATQPERTFCYLHFMDVHNPLPAELTSSTPDAGPDAEPSAAELLGHYHASVRTVDGHIGRVLKALEDAGLLEDTWVLVTADHGEELSEHGTALAHGRTLYRELVHVPLVVRPPSRGSRSRIVGQPVQLVDIAPTILELTGCPRSELPGRSLLPLMRDGSAASPRAAFSEFLRRDRYVQSVTTETHQLIRSYLFERLPVASAADLRPGMPVEVKGRPVRGGPFLATKVSVRPTEQAKVRGAVEQVNATGRELRVMGFPIQIDERTSFAGWEDEPFGAEDLAVGDEISVTLARDARGRHLAREIERRKSGWKAKIEGSIERVQELGNRRRSITVLGVDIPIDDHVAVSPLQGKRTMTAAKADALSRVRAGEAIETTLELYDLASDPRETRNIVDERRDVADELEGVLDAWTPSLPARH